MSEIECWEMVGTLEFEMRAQYGVYIRPSVAMPVMFVVLSHSSFHVRLRPVTFIGVLCMDMAVVSNSHVTQRQHRLIIFSLSWRISLLMRIA